MRVAVAFVGMVVVFFRLGMSLGPSLAFICLALKCLTLKCLTFSDLGLGGLACRIARFGFLCCFVQVISLSAAAGGRHGKIKVF